MSDLQSSNEVVAILCADIHLSHNPPTARSAEPDWLKAQERVLWQLRDLITEHESVCCCAGDIFHRSNPPPSLINFAIKYLPTMYAVPGQHDLPYHRYEDISASAYGTLVLEGTIKNIEPDKPIWHGPLVLHGFPFGFPVKPLEKPNSKRIDVAVIHDFVWAKGHSYPGAPEEKKLLKIGNRFRGYNVVVIGDNHDSFIASVGKDCRVYNCGCLIRRSIDERKYKPSVGLLYADGHIERHFLDTSEDKWIDEEETKPELEIKGMDEFLSELRETYGDSLSYRQAVERWIRDNGNDSKVSKMLVELLGE